MKSDGVDSTIRDQTKGEGSVIVYKTKVLNRYSALYQEVVKGNPPDLEQVLAGEAEMLRDILGRADHEHRYNIRRRINKGGMGTLYYVFDKDFERHCTLKVILPDLKQNESIVRSFVREARITAQLEHPNIVPVHDLGFLPDYGIYFTMKYVRGESLIEILRRLEAGDPETLNNYDIYALLNMFRRVCDAVAFAHSRQILHRDIKPHNIMVGDYGEVLLMDWGLARMMRRGRRRQGTEAVSGTAAKDPDGTSAVVKGSPGYMSPEQARGENARLDARSDVFLLGATLYHILTSTPPYYGDTIEEILELAKRCKYTPPEDMARHLPHYPDELCRIINKAMAPNPDDRYQSVVDLATDLDGMLVQGRIEFRTRIFAKGEYLMKEGDVGEESYIIVRGEVEVYKEVEGRRVVLCTMSPGHSVGELALITHQPRSASVKALRETEVMVLSMETFTRYLRKLPSWMQNTIVHMAGWLREADAKMLRLDEEATTARRRLAEAEHQD